MAILNFPINPNHNDSYSANGIEYLYDSDTTSWAVQPNLGYTGSTGFTGSKGAGFTGSRGSLGYTGSTGDLGYTGSQGPIGYGGSSQSQGIRYAYDDNTTPSGALTGEVRFNNATIGNATQIGIHITDANSNDMTDYFTGLDNFGSGTFYGYIQIRPADVTDGTSQIFKVESTFTLASNVLTATISNIGGALSLTDTDQILVLFIPAVKGDQGVIGYTGSQGVIGYTGSQGDIGYTGSKGDTGNDGTSINIAGSVADVNVNPPNNPQTTLNNAFPSATAGDGVVDQALGDLWTYDGSTWTNVGQFVGYTGSKGDIGYTGSRGTTGYTGSRGSLGYTGSQGPIGYTGSKGDSGGPGFTGSRGAQGYTGSKGDQGYTGSRGDVGYTGSQGAAGGGTGIAIAMALVFG